jgi:hypothetical protein
MFGISVKEIMPRPAIEPELIVVPLSVGRQRKPEREGTREYQAKGEAGLPPGW